MKSMKNNLLVALFILLGAAACKKDEATYSKNLLSFKLIEKDEEGVAKEYPGVISGDEIVVELPSEVDVTQLASDFEVDNARTIVTANGTVQETNVSLLDYTNPVTFTVKAEDKSLSTYTVRVDKSTAIKSFGFYKADNPDLLQSDYVATMRGLTIAIAVPESLDLSNLVARFETTAGAVLKKNSEVQESGKSAQNFSSEVEYTLEAPGLTAPLSYQVKISYQGPQWSRIANEDVITPGVGGPNIAINPVSGEPYIAYTIDADEDEDQKVAVMRYSDGAWNFVGSKTGISESRGDDPVIAFDESGTPYIAYIDFVNSDQKITVKKLLGTAWENVGSPRFTPMIADILSMAVDAYGDPMVAVRSNSRNLPAYPRRGGSVFGLRNNQWTDLNLGSVSISSAHLFRGDNGTMYLGAMNLASGSKPSLFMYENSAWKSVGPTTFTAPDGAAGNVAVSGAVSADGRAYLAYQAYRSSSRINHVMMFNGTTWVELGNEINTNGKKDNFAIGTYPDGTLFYVYANDKGLFSKTFNKSTNNWNSPRTVIAESVLEFKMQVSAKGVPHLIAKLSRASKVVVYKYDLPN